MWKTLIYTPVEDDEDYVCGIYCLPSLSASLVVGRRFPYFGPCTGGPTAHYMSYDHQDSWLDIPVKFNTKHRKIHSKTLVKILRLPYYQVEM